MLGLGLCVVNNIGIVNSDGVPFQHYDVLIVRRTVVRSSTVSNIMLIS